jgi:hypothetical protein
MVKLYLLDSGYGLNKTIDGKNPKCLHEFDFSRADRRRIQAVNIHGSKG